MEPVGRGIFLHIPKTAGRSFRNLLRQEYGKACVYEADEDKFGYQLLTDYQKRQIKFFMGHLQYGVHTRIEGPTTYLTFVRDPVDRVISDYHFVVEEVKNPQKELYSRFPFNKAVEQNFLRNIQTKFLCGVGQGGDGMSAEQAIRNIEERFVSVGIVEHMQESVERFAEIFGWANPFMGRVNVTKNRPRKHELSEGLIAKIHELNFEDYKVYSYALERFMKICS